MRTFNVKTAVKEISCSQLLTELLIRTLKEKLLVANVELAMVSVWMFVPL